MPRYPRLFLPHYPLHIVQRGHDRQSTFFETSDYQYYLDNLIEAKQELKLQVYAYCLMTNHVHLLVAPGVDTDSVSTLMRILAGRQTRYVNKIQGRTGTLWEGRFNASLVDSDNYLLACYRYVDLNPVRASLVHSPEKYRWSSYRQHTAVDVESWLDESDAFKQLGESRVQRASAYRSLVEAGMTDYELLRIRTAVRRNQITGSERFRRRLEARVGRRISALAQGRPSKKNKPDTF